MDTATVTADLSETEGLQSLACRVEHMWGMTHWRHREVDVCADVEVEDVACVRVRDKHHRVRIYTPEVPDCQPCDHRGGVSLVSDIAFSTSTEWEFA